MDGSSNLGDEILDQAGDAIIFADRSGTIRRWNRAAAALFGFAAEEARGHSLDLILASDAGRWTMPFRRRATDGEEGMLIDRCASALAIDGSPTEQRLSVSVAPLSECAARLSASSGERRSPPAARVASPCSPPATGDSAGGWRRAELTPQFVAILIRSQALESGARNGRGKSGWEDASLRRSWRDCVAVRLSRAI